MSRIRAKFYRIIAFLRSSKKAILLILVCALLTIVLSTLVSMWLSKIYNINIPSLGTISTLGVKAYGGDIKLENGIEFIDWGTNSPGALTSRSFYVQSISSGETTLQLNTTNWTFLDFENNTVSEPSKSYMNVTWNYDETKIQPYQAIQVTLTLSVSSSPEFINYLVNYEVTTFSFDILIKAHEHRG